MEKINLFETEQYKATAVGVNFINLNEVDFAALSGRRGWNPMVAAGQQDGLRLRVGDVIEIPLDASKIGEDAIGDTGKAWQYFLCAHTDSDGREMPAFKFSLSYYKKFLFGVPSLRFQGEKSLTGKQSGGDWRKIAATCGTLEAFLRALMGKRLVVTADDELYVPPFDPEKRYDRNSKVTETDVKEWNLQHVYSFDIVDDGDVEATGAEE